MKTSSVLDTYQTWLTHRGQPATIKYTKALARFLPIPGRRGHPDPRDRCSLAG